MFTGLIEAVGKVAEVSRTNGSSAGDGLVRLRMESPFSHKLREGESVAVDGVCLTVVGKSTLRSDRESKVASRPWFQAEVVPETLSKTTLESLKPGDSVNLERALKVGDRLGGHFVQGHVDGVGKVVELKKEGEDVRLFVEIPPSFRRFVAEKGSIALSGVSLTVASVSRDKSKHGSKLVVVEVALIPHTLTHTTLGKLEKGDGVNVEIDLLARYIQSLVGPSTTSSD